MKEILEQFIEHEELLSLYMNPQDTSKFVCGYLLGVNDKQLAVYMISPSGSYDGILVRKIETLIRIESGDNYIKNIKSLCNIHNSQILDEKFDGNNFFYSVLELAKEKNKIVACELFDSGCDDVTGFVEDIRDQICCIKQVNFEGDEDGCSYVRIDDISQISLDSENEQKLLIKSEAS